MVKGGELLEVHRCIPADKKYLIFLFAQLPSCQVGQLLLLPRLLVSAASEPLKVVQVVGQLQVDSQYSSAQLLVLDSQSRGVFFASALSLHSRINNVA